MQDTSEQFLRVLQVLDGLAEILLLAVIAHYLLYPPTMPVLSDDLRQYGSREYTIIIFAVAMLARPWTIKMLSPLLVVLAFLLSMPSWPSFSTMQLAFATQLISIHLPSPSSPFLFIPPRLSLPLMVLIKRSIFLIFTPIVLFYLPAILLAAILLSLSLADTSLNLNPILDYSTTSPMGSRITFITLFGILALLLLLALVTGAAALPSLCKADLPSTSYESTWDAYGPRIGLCAREEFVRTLVWYSTPCYFPPPFNILQIFISGGPSALWILAGYQQPHKGLHTLEKFVWRVTVGPLVTLVAIIWLWNLRY